MSLVCSHSNTAAHTADCWRNSGQVLTKGTETAIHLVWLIIISMAGGMRLYYFYWNNPSYLHQKGFNIKCQRRGQHHGSGCKFYQPEPKPSGFFLFVVLLINDFKTVQCFTVLQTKGYLMCVQQGSILEPLLFTYCNYKSDTQLFIVLLSHYIPTNLQL